MEGDEGDKKNEEAERRMKREIRMGTVVRRTNRMTLTHRRLTMKLLSPQILKKLLCTHYSW